MKVDKRYFSTGTYYQGVEGILCLRLPKLEEQDTINIKQDHKCKENGKKDHFLTKFII
tara:strand:+ start:237 stop:410 length:174 start_codon:yes stop_codon:yes gene_type:complete